jgi:hypothetical protein
MGVAVTWDGRAWQIANMGERHVCLLGQAGDFIELPVQSFESLATHGRILRADADRQPRAGITDQLRRASQRDLEVANQRAKLVRFCLDGSPMPTTSGPRPALCVAGSLRTGPPSESSGMDMLLFCRATPVGATGMRSCQSCPSS